MRSSFQIIPVLDLKGGEVVRARAGERDKYRPIVSPLAASSDPVDVLGGLLTLAPFRAVYIADLDAITGVGDNGRAVRQLAQRFPDREFWLDGGFSDSVSAQRRAQAGNTLVFGSESLPTLDALAEALAAFGRSGAILSLDYRDGCFVGPRGLDEQPDRWPQRIILMDLGRVGMKAGPGFMRLQELAARAEGRKIFAAGGVRDADDIERLASLGIAGALVATALHEGRLPRELLLHCA